MRRASARLLTASTSAPHGALGCLLNVIYQHALSCSYEKSSLDMLLRHGKQITCTLCCVKKQWTTRLEQSISSGTLLPYVRVLQATHLF